jgi:PAS domain S-box-containing protein
MIVAVVKYLYSIGCAFCLTLALLILSTQLLNAAASTQIFVLHSYSQEYPWTRGQHEGFIKALSEDVRLDAAISTEYLDTKRRTYDKDYENEAARHLQMKYKGYKPAAIYVTDDNALLFARDHLSRIFPGVPAFFSGVNDYGVRNSLDSTLFTGVFERKEVAPNLEWLLRLDEDANDLVFVGDGSNTYQAIENEARNDLISYRLRATFVAEKRLDHTLARLRDLPGKYLFLTTLGGMTDANGQVLSLRDIMKSLALTGRIVISMEDAYTIEGVLGGYVTSGHKQGMSAARLFLAYHHGRPVADLPPVLKSPNALIFDDRVLQQYGISLPESLRAQAVILNPRPGFYEHYRSLILGGLIGLAILLLLVVTGALVVLSRKNRELLIAGNRAETANLLFNQLAEQSRTVHWESDAEGLYTFVSPLSYEVLGYLPEELVDKKHFYELLDDAAGDSNKTEIMKFLTQKRPFHDLENKIRTKEGRLIWVLTSGIPMLDDHGALLGYRGSGSDITDRKQAEEERAILADIGRLISSTLYIDEVNERVAAESKKLIHFDSLTINLYNCQAKVLCVAYVSGLDIDGRRKGDPLVLEGSLSEAVILARTGFRIQPAGIEEIVDRFPRLLSIYRAGLQSMICVPLISRDEVIGVMHFRSMRRDAYTEHDLHLAERIGMQIAGAIANAQLYSDLQKTEKSFRENEKRFRTLIEHAAVGIAEVEAGTGRFLAVNRKLCEMVGRTEEEMLTSNFTTITHPEDANLHVTLSKQLYDGEIDHYSLEKRYLRADGGVIWVNVTISRLWRHGEVPRSSITITHDITDRKWSEEEKRRLEERLQRSEKMEALGQLAGGVAHDLNNVLGVLTGYSELLLGELPEGKRTRGYVEKILQSTEKGAVIIQDLLTLARRGVTISDVININRIISGFLMTPVFEKMKDLHPDVTFRIECDEDLPNIKGSPVHLEKTLMNLVSNALEAISGKGEVVIRTDSCHFDKPVKGYDEIREGDYAVLTISDTGMGIPPENRNQIFEPFYTKKTMGRSGTGLGLSIVWGTVKDHNGYIDLQTEEGEGTTFTLYFPVTGEELLIQRQKLPLERYMGNGESVLVVDDIAEQRDIAARLLEKLGYDIHVAASGEEAVEYLRGNKADIMVLDMIMTPGIDGLETYRRVLEINPKQKAILVSGFSETERVRKAQMLGAGAYVKKPYMMEKIGVAIRDEIAR